MRFKIGDIIGLTNVSTKFWTAKIVDIKINRSLI